MLSNTHEVGTAMKTLGRKRFNDLSTVTQLETVRAGIQTEAIWLQPLPSLHPIAMIPTKTEDLHRWGQLTGTLELPDFVHSSTGSSHCHYSQLFCPPNA